MNSQCWMAKATITKIPEETQPPRRIRGHTGSTGIEPVTGWGSRFSILYFQYLKFQSVMLAKPEEFSDQNVSSCCRCAGEEISPDKSVLAQLRRLFSCQVVLRFALVTAWITAPNSHDPVASKSQVRFTEMVILRQLDFTPAQPRTSSQTARVRHCS